MTTAGIDAGGEYLKVVLVDDDEISSFSNLRYGSQSVLETAQKGLGEAIDKTRKKRGEIERIAATGVNREEVTFADKLVLEVSCCARGAMLVVPTVRTVIDLGLNRTTVIRCEDGNVLRIARNDKCAAGTARYLKIASKLLHVPEEETGKIALKSAEEVNLEATCTVFVESEIISLIHQGRKPESILRGVFRALARKIYPLLVQVNFQKDVVLLGGMASNAGIIAALDNEIGYKPVVPENPAIVVALGAAILAKES